MREANSLQRGPRGGVTQKGCWSRDLKKARERAQGSRRSEHARGRRCCAQGREEAGLLGRAGAGEQLEKR